MKDELKIKISKDYYKMPMGRYYPKDGDYTGDKFRKDFLEPNFDEYKKIIIDLDDLYACPSSFREEAFAGLVRALKIKPQDVLDKLVFETIDFPDLINIIHDEIKNAYNKQKLF